MGAVSHLSRFYILRMLALIFTILPDSLFIRFHVDVKAERSDFLWKILNSQWVGSL